MMLKSISCMCFQLDDAQKHFFSFVMTYYEMQNCFKKQRGKISESFYAHLTSGAVVGKIRVFLLQLNMYHGHKLEQPYILVTGSTGKAAFHVNRLTLHSSFICK